MRTSSKLAVAAAAAAGAAVATATTAKRTTQRWSHAADPTGGDPFAVPDGDWRTVTSPDGARLATLVAGDGSQATVVLSHCWTGDHRVWGPVACRLAASGHRVVLYDQRGHGRSTVGDAGYTIRALADDLRAVLEQVDVADAVVAGHSMGGMTAQAFAIEHPDVLHSRVRGLVLVATSSGGLGGKAAQEKLGPRVLSSPLLYRAMSRPTLGPFLVRGAVGRQPVLTHLRATRDTFVATPASTTAGFFVAMSAMDLTGGLPSVDVPVTVMVGTRDQLTPPPHARRIADLVPDARLDVITDAGHMLPWEEPDRIADEIARLAAPAAVAAASS